MPTGYTSDIYEGKEVSAKDFIMTCARAFGALIMMRDEPMDAEIPEFKPSSYHMDAIVEATNKFNDYKSMTHREANIKSKRDFDNALESYDKHEQEKVALKLRYEKVLFDIELWNPPTNKHVALKEYAVNQLKESIEFDCGKSYSTRPVSPLSAEEYINNGIEKAKEDITYHIKHSDEEAKRINERNEWVKQLKESL